jgi:hypothetical protein
MGGGTRVEAIMARSKPVRVMDQEFSEPYRGDRSEVNAATLVFLGAIVALAAFIWFGAGSASRAALVLTCVLGGVTGWGAGILLTPYKSEEAPSDLQKILLAGLIGYLIAKFNTLSDLIAGLGGASSGVVPILPHVAVALIMFISAMGLTYVHRTYKMSRPAREAVLRARIVKTHKSEKRDNGARRPIAVPRLPLEGLTSKVSEAVRPERQSQS